MPYAPGDWNATCFQCGRKFKASQLSRHWQGHWVCPECYEPRHPQDFVKGVRESNPPPFVQPQWEHDIHVYVCDIDSRSAIPGYAVGGCMMPGNTVLSYN